MHCDWMQVPQRRTRRLNDTEEIQNFSHISSPQKTKDMGNCSINHLGHNCTFWQGRSTEEEDKQVKGKLLTQNHIAPRNPSLAPMKSGKMSKTQIVK